MRIPTPALAPRYPPLHPLNTTLRSSSKRTATPHPQYTPSAPLDGVLPVYALHVHSGHSCARALLTKYGTRSPRLCRQLCLLKQQQALKGVRMSKARASRRYHHESAVCGAWRLHWARELPAGLIATRAVEAHLKRR